MSFSIADAKRIIESPCLATFPLLTRHVEVLTALSRAENRKEADKIRRIRLRLLNDAHLRLRRAATHEQAAVPETWRQVEERQRARGCTELEHYLTVDDEVFVMEEHQRLLKIGGPHPEKWVVLLAGERRLYRDAQTVVDQSLSPEVLIQSYYSLHSTMLMPHEDVTVQTTVVAGRRYAVTAVLRLEGWWLVRLISIKPTLTVVPKRPRLVK